MVRRRSKRSQVTVAIPTNPDPEQPVVPQAISIHAGLPDREKRHILRGIDREIKALSREFRRTFHASGHDDEDVTSLALLFPQDDD